MRPQRKGTQPFDLGLLRELVRDDRVWCGIGRVYKPDGSAKHWSYDHGDILVNVRFMPYEQPLWTRLGALGSKGAGVWRIPAPDTEVAVLFHNGHIDGDPMIVTTMASQSAPENMADDTTYVVDGKVVLGKVSGSDALMLGSTYRQHEETFHTAMQTYLTAMNTAWGAMYTALATLGQPTGAAAATTAATAVTTFQTALTTFENASSQYLSTVVKTA